MTASYNQFAAGRWVAIRTDIFSALCVGVTGFFCIASVKMGYEISPSNIGVALTSITQIVGMMAFTIKLITDVEVKMSSV